VGDDYLNAILKLAPKVVDEHVESAVKKLPDSPKKAEPPEKPDQKLASRILGTVGKPINRRRNDFRGRADALGSRRNLRRTDFSIQTRRYILTYVPWEWRHGCPQ
jgi:hypothetical protein